MCPQYESPLYLQEVVTCNLFVLSEHPKTVGRNSWIFMVLLQDVVSFEATTSSEFL